MGVRYFCDLCGEVGDHVGRIALNVTVSRPHKTGNHLPNFDAELCGVCLDRVCRMIKEALASKRLGRNEPAERRG